MPRHPTPDSLIARVRAWFGLTQAELALYLGISPPLVRDLETGRRPLSPAVRTALLPLLLQLPPPAVPAHPGAGAALPPDTPAPAPADLDFRRRECLHRAKRLLSEADALAARAHVAARWATARPALLPPPSRLTRPLRYHPTRYTHYARRPGSGRRAGSGRRPYRPGPRRRPCPLATRLAQPPRCSPLSRRSNPLPPPAGSGRGPTSRGRSADHGSASALLANQTVAS